MKAVFQFGVIVEGAQLCTGHLLYVINLAFFFLWLCSCRSLTNKPSEMCLHWKKKPFLAKKTESPCFQLESWQKQNLATAGFVTFIKVSGYWPLPKIATTSFWNSDAILANIWKDGRLVILYCELQTLNRLVAGANLEEMHILPWNSPRQQLWLCPCPPVAFFFFQHTCCSLFLKEVIVRKWLLHLTVQNSHKHISMRFAI